MSTDTQSEVLPIGNIATAVKLLTQGETTGCPACVTMAVLVAFGALESALWDLRAKGRFQTKAHMLRKLMIESRRQGVEWLDYPRLARASARRNVAAHGRLLFDSWEAREYVEAIGAQVDVWSASNMKGLEDERR